MFTSDHVGVVFFSVDCVLSEGRDLTRLVEKRLGLCASDGTAEPDDTGPDADRWDGVPESALRAELEGLALRTGVQETVDWCWRNGLVPIALSLSWTPIVAQLADRFGFHSYSGRPLDTSEGLFVGGTARPVNAADQRRFAVRRADELGVALTGCAAVGACHAEGPLFDAVGMSIAFDAPDDVRVLADTAVDGDDLRTLIPALEQLRARTR